MCGLEEHAPVGNCTNKCSVLEWAAGEEIKAGSDTRCSKLASSFLISTQTKECHIEQCNGFTLFGYITLGRNHGLNHKVIPETPGKQSMQSLSLVHVVLRLSEL